MHDVSGDEGAGPMPAKEKTCLHKFVEGLAHRHPADSGLLGDLALRRQRVSGLERSFGDSRFDGEPELEVKRSGTRQAQALAREEDRHGRAHAAAPFEKRSTARETAPSTALPRGSARMVRWRSARWSG